MMYGYMIYYPVTNSSDYYNDWLPCVRGWLTMKIIDNPQTEMKDCENDWLLWKMAYYENDWLTCDKDNRIHEKDSLSCDKDDYEND